MENQGEFGAAFDQNNTRLGVLTIVGSSHTILELHKILEGIQKCGASFVVTNGQIQDFNASNDQLVNCFQGLEEEDSSNVGNSTQSSESTELSSCVGLYIESESRHNDCLSRTVDGVGVEDPFEDEECVPVQENEMDHALSTDAIKVLSIYPIIEQGISEVGNKDQEDFLEKDCTDSNELPNEIMAENTDVEDGAKVDMEGDVTSVQEIEEVPECEGIDMGGDGIGVARLSLGHRLSKSFARFFGCLAWNENGYHA